VARKLQAALTTPTPCLHFPRQPTLARPQHLRHLATIIFEARQYGVHEGTQHNTRQLVVLHETQERIAATLRLILLLFAGILAFAVLDRLTGGWSVMGTAWFEDFAKPLILNSPVRGRQEKGGCGRGAQQTSPCRPRSHARSPPPPPTRLLSLRPTPRSCCGSSSTWRSGARWRGCRCARWRW
jgi:hypothetical protein